MITKSCRSVDDTTYLLMATFSCDPPFCLWGSSTSLSSCILGGFDMEPCCPIDLTYFKMFTSSRLLKIIRIKTIRRSPCEPFPKYVRSVVALSVLVNPRPPLAATFGCEGLWTSSIFFKLGFLFRLLIVQSSLRFDSSSQPCFLFWSNRTIEGVGLTCIVNENSLSFNSSLQPCFIFPLLQVHHSIQVLRVDMRLS